MTKHLIPQDILDQLPKSILTKEQSKTIKKVVKGLNHNHPYSYLNNKAAELTLRFDDECGNKHNTFSITFKCNGIYGFVPELITLIFTEYKHLIKWHLCNTSGPIYYLPNTLYLAQDKDHYGKRKGEPLNYTYYLQFPNFPPLSYKQEFILWLKSQSISDLEIIHINHREEANLFKPRYSFRGYTDSWHQCPFNIKEEAIGLIEALKNYPWNIKKIPNQISEGKEPELEAARKSAIAPNATLEELQNKDWLLNRLPSLMNEFKQDIENIGFIY
jgi:hypothetical protein